jgi:hypothetical protein
VRHRATGADLDVLPIEPLAEWAGGDAAAGIPALHRRTTVVDLTAGAVEPAWWPVALDAARRAAQRWRARWERVVDPARAQLLRYRVAVGAHQGIAPRRHSQVRHRLRRRPADVLAVLAGARRPAVVHRRRVALRWDPHRFRYDPTDHVHRAPGRLHVPWSFPDLPVWLAVHEWSSDTAIVEVSLRSRRRLRYPRRYFHVAHRTLDLLLDDLRCDGLRRRPAAPNLRLVPAGQSTRPAARRALAAGSWR